MLIYLVARHYPPEISGGARRPSLMADALRRRGHRVRVISPFEPQHDDDMRMGSLPVPLHSSLPSSSLLTTLKTSIVRWTRWPDAEIGWARNVVGDLAKLDPPDWLLTTSPPESSHTIGWQLKRIWPQTLWLAEFRDTWTINAHRPEMQWALRRGIERRMARQILLNVDAISAVSAAVMDEVAAYAPKETPRLVEGHFSDSPTSTYDFPDDEFALLHSGGFTLSDHRRQLQPVLYALTPIAEARPEFRLHITGPLTDAEQALCDRRNWICTHGPRPLHVSRSMQAGADALLLATPQNSHALPGKYSEYALAGRPVIAMGGGSWRALLPKDVTLLPPSALAELPRGSRVPPVTELHVDQAAARLEEFLENVTHGTKTA